MLLGLHTYSFYLHGIGQAWADFKLPWPRQMSTFDLFDEAVCLGLDGLHLDDGVLETLDVSYLKEVNAAAREHGLYLEYNFSMDMGGMGIGIQHDLDEAITTAASLGADIVKVSMDLIRPRPVSASRFHPEVMAQMKSFGSLLKTWHRKRVLPESKSRWRTIATVFPKRSCGCWIGWTIRRSAPASTPSMP